MPRGVRGSGAATATAFAVEKASVESVNQAQRSLLPC
jgi:hypothetical protein